jgi:hypothetical protein
MGGSAVRRSPPVFAQREKIMEHKTFDQLRRVADIHAAERRSLSRRERLERWAEVLEREPSRRLRSLGEIEFKTKDERQVMRADGSPLTVAFQDPVLRAEGLASDRLGDAVAFFELSEGQAHRLLCSCMNGWSMLAGTTARRVRSIANPNVPLRVAVGLTVAALAAAPAALYFFG